MLIHSTDQLRVFSSLRSSCFVSSRPGFSMVELVVAASLLVTVMSVVANLTVSSGRLWQDSRHYRLAIDEVTNQLERLTALDEAQRTEALAQLEPSSQMQDLLPNPVLTAEMIDDQFGNRLVLSLSWDRVGKGTPVTLTSWIDPLSATSLPAAEVTEIGESSL